MIVISKEVNVLNTCSGGVLRCSRRNPKNALMVELGFLSVLSNKKLYYWKNGVLGKFGNFEGKISKKQLYI